MTTVIGSCIHTFDWCYNQQSWMTLNDNCALCFKNVYFGAQHKNLSEYYQRQNCRPMTLVSGNIRFMQIFTEAPWTGAIKWQWVCRQRQFLVLSLAKSLEMLEVRPALLHSYTEDFPHSFSTDPQTPWMTLKRYFTLNSVFAAEGLELVFCEA